MCTAMTLLFNEKTNFFGRTMDFSYDIDPRFYVIPKNQKWQNHLDNNVFINSYGIIAIGQEQDGMLAFFDGVNDSGLAAAALYFPGCAVYDATAEDINKEYVASVDFLHYILGKCGSVEELEEMIPHISIIGIQDPVTQIAAPLHWIVTDKSGNCIVIEPTDKGLQVFKNSIGILANSPGFPWQMTNLRNYIGVTQTQTNEVYWGDVLLKPFGQGAGTMMLPGGYTSPERFVRTAFQKTHIAAPEKEDQAIITCFNIMDSVSVPKGIVMTDRGTYDYTKYTAFMNVNTGEYFVKTYYNREIVTVKLQDYDVYNKPICLGALMHDITFNKYMNGE
ncbi:linear amide C-N hydrolase [Anaerovorax odorimutans]|uniref:linear amide C-N hydrolase n=1 Tax=Anaerovorax odorimutans TaxID=109327 RepID=UPI000415ABC7|nr:choloylglycine hydrolase family protein [Anaerovorax odorimutans]